MNIIIATDAWEPQVNGVVRTLKMTIQQLKKFGHNVTVISPDLFKTFRCPLTHDVDLAYNITQEYVASIIKKPCAIHISTEGPIGLAFVRYCVANDIPFTTAYHTNYPEYIKTHMGIPQRFTIAYLRWLNQKSSAVMVATQTLVKKLDSWNFEAPKKIWSRGVDLNLFYPRPKTIFSDKPIALYVGRVSKEKNIEDFLKISGFTKYVVGDGPERPYLEENYPDTKFTGALHGEELAQMYANADIFVFPSRTDTFGLVVIEALVSGVPVAAYPVEGPIDIIGGNNSVGCLSHNLEFAAQYTLDTACKEKCVNLGRTYNWEACTEQFVDNLVAYV